MATSPITANAFVAYPFEPRLVSDTIAGAVGLSEQKSLKLTPWQKLNVQGLKLDDLIRDKLLETDALIADISTPNFNVYYEIAYALAIEKPVVPIVNVSLDRAKSNVELTGLFDNIGWIEYNNSDELSDNLDEWRAGKWVERYDRGKDHAQPLFILDTFAKSEFRQYIFQAVSARHVNFRSFDPYEIPRLTASKAISLVSSSAGCIIPLLSSDITDHYKHNLRAAFLAGLCHGYGIEPLIIQYYNGPSPADFRDFITNTASRTETHRHVEEYCGQVLIRNQVLSLSGRRYQLGLLNSIDLGASAAENEGASLDKYFIATAQYERASRTDHAFVVGRKGSGKTAIFYQVRNSLLRKKETIVIELRPATHNLSEMREQLLSIVNGGAFDHTISAFWTYILLVEVLLSLREAALPLATRNFEMQDRIRNLEDLLELDDTKVSGDFTSRLEQAIADTIEAFRSDTPKRGVGARAMTNVIYETVIPKLRDMVVDFGDIFDDIVVLIDDIDKGWPPRQLEDADVRTIRHLVESLRRIERDLRKKKVAFKSLLFLRSDVYETLVDLTPDRGKYNPINVDWSDKTHLTHLLKERIVSQFDTEEKSREAWDSFNIVMPDGHFAMEHLIVASLYRPRFLIEACEKVLSTAINRGSGFVTVQDVEHGLRQMSQYLVSDFGYELRDVSGIPEDIFYAFIGKSNHLTESEISVILSPLNITVALSAVIELLMWYGFLGIVSETGDSVFIFECAYDFRRLLAMRSLDKHEVMYAVNPAFTSGLEKL